MGFSARELEVAMLEKVLSKPTLPKPILPEIEKLPIITHFPSPHQIASVAAGEKKIVYSFYLPDDCTGFILRVGNEYYSGDKLVWKVDGKEMDTAHVRRCIGTINAPLEIVPWFRMPFHSRIIWEATNNDEEEHKYEVLCDGFYIDSKDLPLLFRLAGVK